MSLLPTSTFAGPSQAEALWAVAGSVGPGGGVTQLVAGSGITLDPSTGEGVVTINATGGGGGGVSSVTASGAGITASPTSGAVVLANTGVTSLVAGSGISVSSASGAVTVSNTATAPAYTGYQTYTYTPGVSNTIAVTGSCGKINLGPLGTAGSVLFSNPNGTGWQLTFPCYLTNPSFNVNTRLIVTQFSNPNIATGDPLNFTVNIQSWNGGGGWSTSQSAVFLSVSGPGPIPSYPIVPIQYSIEYIVVQVEP